MKGKKEITRDEALLKLASLCARSEQCAFDLGRKLSAWGLSAADAAGVIGELRERRFVDDRRFAEAFTRDKVKFSAWGRMKIRMGLLAKRIPAALIDEAFATVDPDDYAAAAMRAGEAAARRLDLNTREDAVKLYRHLLSRGFESATAMETLRSLRCKE